MGNNCGRGRCGTYSLAVGIAVAVVMLKDLSRGSVHIDIESLQLASLIYTGSGSSSHLAEPTEGASIEAKRAFNGVPISVSNSVMDSPAPSSDYISVAKEKLPTYSLNLSMARYTATKGVEVSDLKGGAAIVGRGKALPKPSDPFLWAKAEVNDEAYVFYWYEMPESEIRKISGYASYKSTGKSETWADLVKHVNSYSPVMCIFVAIYSLRRVGVKRRILLLSTNPDAKDDPILRWLGVEVRLVELQQAVCKSYPGIPERRINNLGQFTKLAVFNQTDIKVAVYLDADVVFVRSLDEELDLFRRSDHGMGVVPYPQNDVCGSDRTWDYGKLFERTKGLRRCLQDEFNCGLMFMRPSSYEFKAAKEMTEDKTNFFDSKCGTLKNKCYLGEADFMHALIRKRYSGKAFCLSSGVECLGNRMNRCDGSSVKLIHWAGRRKPWKEWWDEKNHKPSLPGRANCGGGECQLASQETVRLWWTMHDELYAALAGKINPLQPGRKLHPRGKGSSLRFFEG